MQMKKISAYLICYACWLVVIFVLLIVLRNRFFADPHFPQSMLFMIASGLAVGIAMFQTIIRPKRT